MEQWVLVKGSGGAGLGDRLRAVLSGIAYAKASGRGISVDWRDGVYANPGDNAFEHLFDVYGITYRPPEELECYDSVYPSSWKSRLGESMHNIYVKDGNPSWHRSDAIAQYSFSQNHTNYTEDVLVMWEFDQYSKLQEMLGRGCMAEPYEASLAKIWKTHLRPTQEIEKSICSYHKSERIFRIGVHVRASDEYSAQKGSVSLELYYRKIDSLIRKSTNWELFVATDNIKIEQEFALRYGQIKTWRKWFAEDYDAIHLNSACPDYLRAAKDALAEWIILGTCDYLISVTNSSFSIVARVIANLPSQHQFLVSPRRDYRETAFRRVFYNILLILRKNKDALG